jgi:hypothetical protein
VILVILKNLKFRKRRHTKTRPRRVVKKRSRPRPYVKQRDDL